MKLSTITLGILLVFIFTVFSCKKHTEEYHSVMDKIEAKSKNYHGTSITSDKFTSDIKTIKISEGTHTFFIPERKSQIESFACSECHTKSIKDLKGNTSGKKAHWNISLNHANENTMNCTTCHNPNDLDNLTSLTHKTIDYNNSYNLCSQCHTKQFKDWKGGAHGKRLGGWAPPRVSNTCVNCHNPHDPHFESRFPDRFNTEYEKERQ